MSEKAKNMEKYLPIEIEDLKSLAKLSVPTFKNFLHEVLGRYEVGDMELDLSGGRSIVSMSLPLQKDLAKKQGISLEELESYIDSVVATLHVSLTKMDTYILGLLKDMGKQDLAKRLKKKFSLTEEALKAHPQLRMRYLVTTFCKTRYLEEIEWETSLKIFQSHALKEKMPKYPVSLVRFVLASPESFHGRYERPRPEIFEVELCSRDIDKLIKSLKKMKEEIAKLEKESGGSDTE